MASLNSAIVVPEPGPQTYIVAQNPEVLAHLMRENESRGGSFTPAAYTAPASVFNTVAVDFEKKDDQPILKTCPIPVQTLQKLDPEVGDEEHKMATKNSLDRKSESPKMNSLERWKG